MRHQRHPRKTSHGISLVEILVVTGIIVSIVGIVVFAVGARAKEAAYSASVRSDLKQLTTAISMYMADHDDQYPHRTSAIVKYAPDAPLKATGLKSPLAGCGLRTDYRYLRHQDYVRGERLYVARHGFDATKDAIVKAPFFCKLPGQSQKVTIESVDTSELVEREVRKVLGARLDGSIAWFDSSELWQIEWAEKVGIERLVREAQR